MSDTLEYAPTWADAHAEEAPASAHMRAGPQPVAYDALILDARLRQALVTVRSLGQRGLRVAAMECARSAPAFSSRWCQRTFEATGCVAGEQSYLALLEYVLDGTPSRVLIPSSDDTIDLLRRYRQRLGGRTRIALACEPALRIAINKQQTLDIAQRLGLSVPRGVLVRNVDDIEAAIREIGLPAVIKPTESWVGDERQGTRVTSRLVSTRAEARRVIAWLARWDASALFQRYLTGRREAVSLMYAGDTVYARFAQWAKRTVPPLGGSSVLRQSIAIPEDTGAQAERLVREIGLDGYSEVEFRRDDAGKPYLMEINARLSASVEIAVRAGVDFPHLLYQWASGAPIDSVPGYRVGGWMRHLGGDIETTTMAILLRNRPESPSRARALREFFASFLIPAHYDYVDWRDPLPMWTASTGLARRVLRR